MATRKFTLTDAQTVELRQAYDRTKDGPTRTRYQAVRRYGAPIHPPPALRPADGHPRRPVLDRARPQTGRPGVVRCLTWTSPSSYLALLADCGFTYQRAQKVYKSRSERAILAFEEQLEKT